MSSPLRSLLFVSSEAVDRRALETAPTSGIRVADYPELDEPTALEVLVEEEDEEDEPPPATQRYSVQPGLYVVRMGNGTPIWVHVTPE